MSAPIGLKAIEHFYGDPSGFIRDDGTVSPLWERRMVKVELPHSLPLGWRVNGETRIVTHCRVNEAVAGVTQALLRAWDQEGLWDHFLTFDGAYTWRAKRDSHQLSMHAYGGAIDFNALTNQLGTVGNMSPAVVRIAQGRGWTWGGEWSRPDPMHFQFGGGY